MIALYIILGILAILIIALCIPVFVEADYCDDFVMKAKYLFLTFDISPIPEKVEKEEKDEKEEEKEKKEEPEKEEKDGKKNPFLNFYEKQGVLGVVELVQDTAHIIGGFLKSLARHIIINDLYIEMHIAGNDAAAAAYNYGRVSATFFPALGTIVNTMKVKRYSADVSPDFIADKSDAQFFLRFSIKPIFIVGAILSFAVKAFFKVILKLVNPKDLSSENSK